MDISVGHYTKCNQPVTDEQLLNDFYYMKLKLSSS